MVCYIYSPCVLSAVLIDMNPSTKALYFSVYLLCMNFTVAAQDLLVNSKGDSLNVKVIKIEHKFLSYEESGGNDVIIYAVNKVQLFIPNYFGANAHHSESDLLVKSTGDSLKISLTKIERGFMHFSEYGKVGDQKYAANKIQLYIQEYFISEEKDTSTSQNTSNSDLLDAIGKEDFGLPTFRFVVQGGWSARLASIDPNLPEDQSDYQKGLRTGGIISGGFDVYFHQYLGFGVGYTYFNTNNRMTGHQVTNPTNGLVVTGPLVDDIGIDYLNVKMIGRYAFKQNRYVIYTHVGVGQIWYEDKQYFAGANYQITGETYAGDLGLGLDFRLDKSIAIGFQSNLIYGHLEKQKVDDGIGNSEINNEKYNISRIDLSLGIRWYL